MKRRSEAIKLPAAVTVELCCCHSVMLAATGSPTGKHRSDGGMRREARESDLCGGCFLADASSSSSSSSFNNPHFNAFVASIGFRAHDPNGSSISFCNECRVFLEKMFKFKERSGRSRAVLVKYLKSLKSDEKIDYDYLKNERGRIFPTLSISRNFIHSTAPNDDGSEDASSKRDSEFVVLSSRTIEEETGASDECGDKHDASSDFDNSEEPKSNDGTTKLRERKRSSDAINYSENDDTFDVSIDEDSDRDVPKRSKKTKKSKNAKHKKNKMKSKKSPSNDKDLSESVLSDVSDVKKTSNRMVLETKQYKVIKLNREQILAEMETNSKSKRYLNAPHKCTLCVKGFNYEDVLQNHMTKHEPRNNYFECDLCHQFLPSAVSMRGHKKSHSTKYQCKICNVIKASRQHLLEHYMLVHDGAPRTYICNICGKTLTKRTMFQKHMRIHYPTNKIACDKCGKLFKTIETLRAHMLHHEGGSMSRHTDVKPYSCDQCFKAFRYASLLYTHKITHVTTRNYYCVECDVRFKTQSNLRLHLRKSLKHVDPDLLKFACDQCDKRYEDEKSLRRHVEWVHLRQKNYKCSKCDMQFGSPDGLRSHMKKIHDGIRPPPNHICKICNRAFRAKAVLVKHIRVHTGERPFECEECGKKFAQNSTMTTHIKLVHLKLPRYVNRKKRNNPTNESNPPEEPPKKPVQDVSQPQLPVFTYHPSPVENPDSSYFYATGNNTAATQVIQPMRPNPITPYSKFDSDPRQTI